MNKLAVSTYVFSFLFITNSLFSQNWPETTAEWHYEIGAFSQPIVTYQSFKYDRDTIIDGDTVSILSNNVLIYSDSGKVFYYQEAIDSFVLLYNFNAMEGESWVIRQFNDSLKITVDSIGIESVNGKQIEVQYISNNNPNFWFGSKIYKNIGSNASFLPGSSFADPSGGPIRCYNDSIVGEFKFVAYACDTVIELVQSDNKGLEKENKLLAFPNPASDVIYFQTDVSNVHEVKIYSLVGEILISSKSQHIEITQLQRGTYIYRVFLANRVSISGRFFKD